MLIDRLIEFYNLFCIHDVILCDPISVGVLALGGIAGGVGQVVKAGAEAKAASTNAYVNQQNAQLAIDEGAENERVFRQKSASQLADIQSGFGASGVTMDGSAAEVMRSSIANAQLDALKIRHQAVLKATGFQQDAYLNKERASSAETGGYLSAAGSLLSSGANAYKTIKGV